MKTNFTFLALICLTISGFAQAQICSDLIISEVIEGWSNNKAIEIYNPTSTAIDASGYGLVRFQNGSTTPGNTTYLEGVTVEPFDVVVVVIDKRDPDGVDFEAPVWDELELAGDIFITPNYNDGVEVMYFNGNDAIALLKDNGATLVDVFGKVGDALNPDGWGGYIDNLGEQAYISANHTLVRKANIVTGVTDATATFEILEQYDSLPANTFTMLGSHDCECNADNVTEFERLAVSVFPNPLTDGTTVVSSLENITQVSIYSLTGVLVEEIQLTANKRQLVDLSLLASGSYILNAKLESGIEVSQIVIR